MKVRELIERLQQEDGWMDVQIMLAEQPYPVASVSVVGGDLCIISDSQIDCDCFDFDE